jgi:hypothetical protein
MDFSKTRPLDLANTFIENIGRNVNYRSIDTNGADRAAKAIAELVYRFPTSSHSPNLTAFLPILNITGPNAIRELDGHKAIENCGNFFVTIVLLASGIYILLNLPPEPPTPTTAEQMILQPNDIGPGWQSNVEFQYPMDQVNESSIYNANLGNDTITLYLRIDVFNSTNDSRNAFIRWRSDVVGSYDIISLGDMAIYYPQGTSLPGVIFVSGFVTAWVQTQSYPGYTWQKNATMDIALLQL